MKTPFNARRSFDRLSPQRSRSRVALALLPGLLLGCQSPNLMTSAADKGPTPTTSASARSEKPGLPKPNNTATANGKMAATSIDEHLRLGEEELQQGNYQQAQLHFDHVLAKHPDHSKAHHRLGVLGDKMGQFDQAEQHYLAALPGDPRNSALLSDLGYSYFMQGRYADSERYLLEARRIDPNYKTAVANLGLLYGSTGRQQEALAMLRQIGDDDQVQAIMQQIGAGQFDGPKQGVNNPFVQNPSSVVVTNATVQQPVPVPQENMNDATRNFVEQMRQARAELDQQEQQFAQQQQFAEQQQLAQQQQFAPQSAYAQQQRPGGAHPQPQQGFAPPNNVAPMDGSPYFAQQGSAPQNFHQQQPSPPPQSQDSAWMRQSATMQPPPGRPAPQYAGVTPFGQQPAAQQQQSLQQLPQAGYLPDSALAHAMDAIDQRSPQAQAAQSGSPILIGRPNPQNSPGDQNSQAGWNQNSGAGNQQGTGEAAQRVPIYVGSRQQPTNPPANSPTGMVQQSFNAVNTMQSPNPAVTGVNGAAAQRNDYLQTVNTTQPSAPTSAWGQHFATAAGQRPPNPNARPQSAIQPAGANIDPNDPRAVEQAHYTQQQGQRPEIALAGQNGAANPSLVPPSLNGNWASPQQPQNAQGPPAVQPSGSDASAYERARREAALMGLGAGPGQIFPYVQQTQRFMPGDNSRINGAQYPSPARHMPSGLLPPTLDPAFNSPQPTNLQPHHNYQGQPMPTVAAPVNTASNYSAAGSSSFSQHQQASYAPVPQHHTDPYQDTRTQQADHLNGLINQTWGQSPQSPGYGVTPPSTTEQYGTATSFTPQQSAVPRVPYNQQPSTENGTPIATANYGDAPSASNNAPPQNNGGVVIPEPYQFAPATGGGSQRPSNPSYGTSGNAYGNPMIVPGQR